MSAEPLKFPYVLAFAGGAAQVMFPMGSLVEAAAVRERWKALRGRLRLDQHGVAFVVGGERMLEFVSADGEHCVDVATTFGCSIVDLAAQESTIIERVQREKRLQREIDLGGNAVGFAR